MTTILSSREMDNATTESNAENPVERSLFLRLPREIRDMIYDFLFVRPTGIVPWICTGNPEKPIPYAIFQQKTHNDGKQYSFDDMTNSSYTRTSPEKVLLDITWTAPATLQEISKLSIVEKEPGCTIIPNGLLLKDDKNDEMRRLLHVRCDGAYEIIRCVPSMVEVIHGVALLATCKMLNAEGGRALYGKNLFVFNSARSTGLYEQYDEFTVQDDLSYLASSIPGISRYGRIASNKETSAAMKRLFTEYTFYAKEPGACHQDRKLPKFVRQDSLLTFLNRIRMKNASLFENLKIEDEWYKGHLSSIGFNGMIKAQLKIEDKLRIYTTILNALDCKIESLILHRWKDKKDIHFPDPITYLCTHVEAAMGEAVELLVNKLPTLKTLQLGHYTCEMKPEHIDEWRMGARWSAVVRQGAAETKPLRTQRPIGAIIENIHREANAYYSEIRDLFNHLPFMSGAAWDEFESRYTPRMESGSDQRANRRSDKENWWNRTRRIPTITRRVDQTYTFFRPMRWMGLQYHRYRFDTRGDSSTIKLLPKGYDKPPTTMSFRHSNSD
ncbi:hypothetical protein HYFRA_00001407 [Hymenoscyphus fraxineus]|uniref:Uncharacterized protein n=1 Tax=Hymenoscyphus fraxineus TaxID=746836 RepID=A0A9N9L7I5_9HELO|nr:hypothetical protein HYFRA_00001407 [Hymenoscyphus fraxineus]